MKTNEIIDNHQFHIKKKYGQNFLTSDSILEKIVTSAELSKEIGVIEIGPGLGALTAYLAREAKHVLAYEIDDQLIPILDETLSEYKNITIVNNDILKVNVNQDIKEYLSECKEIYVVANLPYYITTPILMHLLQTTKVNKYIVMMQLEVADRICGKASTKQYNSLSIAIQYRANVKKLFKVPKTVFNPSPNVDSAVIEIRTYEKPKYFPLREYFFFDVVRSSFAQRRKTLVNNLVNRFGNKKEDFIDLLNKLKFKESVRSEELTIEDFVLLSDELYNVVSVDELLAIYDEKGDFTGKTIKRGQGSSRGEYLKVVLIVLKCNDLLLIQKRSKNKVSYPNYWDIVGGAVLAYENEQEAAKREVYEEMGIKLDEIKLVDYHIVDDKFHRYVYEANISKDVVVSIDHNEVTDYKWVKLKDLDKMDFLKRDLEILKRIYK